MKYQLKDRELQKKLEEIGGEQNVKKAISEYEETNFGGAVFAFSINDKFRITVGTIKDEIEEFHEYNPKAWNDFPAVTPPEGQWMRCEWLACARSEYSSAVVRMIARYVADGDSNEMIWLDYEGRKVEVDRFRPWED